MGPISPGRWQTWHFCCRMGSTSLLKVTGDPAANAPALHNRPAIQRRMNRTPLSCFEKPRTHFKLYSIRTRARTDELYEITELIGGATRDSQAKMEAWTRTAAGRPPRSRTIASERLARPVPSEGTAS